MYTTPNTTAQRRARRLANLRMLAYANQVVVGMSDRPGSDQSGVLSAFYTYDAVVVIPYSLSDTEADVLVSCLLSGPPHPTKN